MTTKETSGKSFLASFSLSSSAQKDMRKIKSGVLLALFLLPGILFAFPIGVSAFSGSTSTAPAAVTGATAAMDVPVFANIALASSDTRIVTVSNPNGNAGIVSITISVPAGSLKATTAPSGSIPTTGGVPDCSGTACPASVFGSGPWSVQYLDTSAGHSGATILPGGASIQLTFTETPEVATAVSGVADTFPLSIAVTDTTGAITTLNAINIVDTQASIITLGTLSATQVTAGSTFTFTASTTDTGIPLQTSTTPTNIPATTTVSPATFTTGASATTLTANDTMAEHVTVTVSTGKGLTGTTGGLLSATTGSVNVVAGASSALAITINGNSNTHQINMTSSTLIPKAQISVTTTDKFGNSVTQTSGLKVTLAANTITGAPAGFTAATVMGTAPSSATYPYTPTDIAASTTFFISANQNTNTSSLNYYFSPDYGSMSSITASAGGVTAQTSGTIVTWGFNSGAATLSVQGGTTVTAGNAGTIDALVGAPLTTQAGVPVYFTITSNSTGYAGTFSNGLRSLKTSTTANTTGGGMAVGLAALNVYTLSGATATVTVTYGVNPTTNATANTITLTTATGKFASLSVKAYFDAGDVNKATAVAASGTLYLDVSAADAYGNPLAIATGTTLQVNLATTAGSLSSATAYIVGPHTDTLASGYQVQLIAPASGSFTVTATGSYSGVVASGSLTLSIVSKSPTVAFTSVPTTVTTGIAQQITGWANVSIGVAPTTITSLKYSLNGAANVSLGAGSATNQFTITTLLAKTNTLTVYATDGNGVTTTASVSIPVVATSASFTFPSFPLQGTLGSFATVSVNVTNNQPTTINAVVIVSVTNAVAQNGFASGSTAGIFTTSAIGPTAIAPGTTATLTIVVSGLAHGSYVGTVFVLSTSGVPLSPTTTLPMTI